MKLRFTVEGKFAATFTETTSVKDDDELNRKLFALSLLNQKAGYKKYSSPILYDDQNKIVRRLCL